MNREYRAFVDNDPKSHFETHYSTMIAPGGLFMSIFGVIPHGRPREYLSDKGWRDTLAKLHTSAMEIAKSKAEAIGANPPTFRFADGFENDLGIIEADNIAVVEAIYELVNPAMPKILAAIQHATRSLGCKRA